MRKRGIGRAVAAAFAATLASAALVGCAAGGASASGAPGDAGSPSQAASASAAAASGELRQPGQGTATAAESSADGQELRAAIDAALAASSLDNVTVSLDIAADVIDSTGSTSRTNLIALYRVDRLQSPGRLHVKQDVLSNVLPETKVEYYLADGQGLVAVFDDRAVSMTQEQANLGDVSDLTHHVVDSGMLQALPGYASAILSEDEGGGQLIECQIDLPALAATGALGDTVLPDDMAASQAYADYIIGADGRISRVRITYDMATSSGEQWLYEMIADYSAYGATTVADAPAAITYDEYRASLDSAKNSVGSQSSSSAAA